MSDQGVHEVQLSGKQLLFLFMSLVVLAVVIFLLGVDVGRGVRNAVGDTEVSAEVRPAESPADPAAPGTDPAKPAQPELSYHEMLLGEAKPPAASQAQPKPETVSPKPETVSPKPETAPKPEAPVPLVAAPPPAPPAAAPPAASAGDLFLQMGAYSTRAVADAEAAKLIQLKVPAFVLPPAAGSADKFFRVRVGPYKDRAEAEQVKSRLARQGKASVITR